MATYWCPWCEKFVPGSTLVQTTDPDTGEKIWVCKPCKDESEVIEKANKAKSEAMMVEKGRKDNEPILKSRDI